MEDDTHRGLLGLLRTVALACCISLVAAHAPLSSKGVTVNLSGAPIALSAVWSTALFDYDFVSGGVSPTYFNDCLYYSADSNRSIERIEFVFALSTVAGELRGPLLPVNVVYRKGNGNRSGDRLSACRRHGYEDGAKGLRLIAWVNAVHFLDGTEWHAPTVDSMQSIITGALSRQ